MKQILFLVIITIFFSGCFATKNYNFSSNQEVLTFKTNEQKPYVYKLINPKFQYTFDGCTQNSYIMTDASLFLESIELKSMCQWNGSANGYFEYQLKQKLGLKSLTAISRFEVGNYIFSTLKVNETHKLQTIHYWSALKDLFIIDYDGVLTFSLQKELDVHNQVTSITLPRYVKRYNQSLVKMNFFYNYFKIEDDTILPIKN